MSDTFKAIRTKVYETLVMYTYQSYWNVFQAGEVAKADSDLSICINSTVFSFVMTYNNRNVGGLFGCHITFCVQNQCR